MINSDQNSILTDSDGNVVNVSMFEYHLEENLFTSIGKIVLIEENTVTLDIYRGTKVKFDKNSISFEMSSAK